MNRPNLAISESHDSLGILLVAFSYSFIVFSSPMPASYGWPEVIIGAGLVFGGLHALYSILKTGGWREKNNLTVFFLLLYLSVVPFVIGLVRHYPKSDILRDIIPFFFLTLPFLYRGCGGVNTKIINLLIGVIVFVGLVSAFQFFCLAMDRLGSVTKWISAMEQGLSLSSPAGIAMQTSVDPGWRQQGVKWNDSIVKMYDPAVLFAAVYLICIGFKETFSSVGRRFLGLISIVGSFFCSYCYMMLGLRAPLGLIIISLFVYSLILARTDVKFRNRILFFLPLSFFVAYPFVKDAIHLMWMKQYVVGTNGKMAEWSAVFGNMSSFGTLFTGIGWGGLFENPIYLYKTRFTHSMLSFYLLKTGLLGLLSLIGAFVLVFSQKVVFRNTSNPRELIVLIAATPPMLVALLFQPSYKMLSLSLILILLLMSMPDRGSERS